MRQDRARQAAARGVLPWPGMPGAERWRMTNALENYRLWQQSLRNATFADILFVTALNLAEERRGGLLVVLDDPHAAGRLISHSDLLSSTPSPHPAPGHASKDQFHSFATRQVRAHAANDDSRDHRAHRWRPPLLLDTDAHLLAFGAIVYYPDLATLHPDNIEGGRAARPLRRHGSAGRSSLFFLLLPPTGEADAQTPQPMLWQEALL